MAISITPVVQAANAFLKNILAGRVNEKPVVLALLGDSSVLPADFVASARENKLIISRSSDRTLRALGAVVRWANRSSAPAPQAVAFPAIPHLGTGAATEWLGKDVLRAAGIAVPPGRLARTADEAVAVASEIGFPVALKAQAAALAHKTEAGGVLLGVSDADAIYRGLDHAVCERRTRAARLALDGVLVEAMAARGLELVAGARRDPEWGPVLLVGLGGIFVEALNDVRLIAAAATHAEILTELSKLASAKLLHGRARTAAGGRRSGCRCGGRGSGA